MIQATNQNFVQIKDYVNKAVEVLCIQNNLLSHHPNANLYIQMAQFVELEGFYLESEPCLVCNNPEVPLCNIKLSSIKVDSKFTTTTQIVKLSNSYTISKITVRIADLKRTKMVRTINIYYNNRNVQAVVELKNKPGIQILIFNCSIAFLNLITFQHYGTKRRKCLFNKVKLK